MSRSEHPELFGGSSVPPPAGGVGRRPPRRPRHCRFTGCVESYIAFDNQTHWYCPMHECDQPGCVRQVEDRHRCKGHRYCAVDGCDQMRRAVSAAKYCLEHTTCVDYRLTALIPEPTGSGVCVICDLPATSRRRLAGPALLLCRKHGRLRDLFSGWRHRYSMSDDQLRALVTEARCWICGESVAWRFESYAHGPALGKIHVEHDHACCDNEGSCGRCIRGLAHEQCNWDLGHVERLLRRTGTTRFDKLIDELTGEK